jgi:adenylate cyclase
MRRRRILTLGILAGLVATGIAAWSPAAFSFVDLRIYDAMLRRSSTRAPSPRIVIIAIDDRSLSEIGQWPWTRDVIARLVEGIRQLGARVVSLDVLLAEPDRYERGKDSSEPSTDAALAAVVAQGRVVMSYALTFSDSKEASACVLHPVSAVFVEGDDRQSPVNQLFHARGVVCSLPALTGVASGSGFLNASADRDGVLRREPLLMEYGGHIYPSLALATVLEATGAKRVTLTGMGSRRSLLQIDSTRVPLDEGGTLLIRFRGRRGTYTHLSAADVLAGRLPPNALKDRIVFIGATALGVQDIVATPFDTAVAGIEAHASAADTLLQRDFVSTPPYWRVYELAGAFAFALAVAVLVAAAGFLYGSVVSSALLAVLWSATYRGVDGAGVFLSPVFPTLGWFLSLTALTVAKVRHERQRADTERTRRQRAHQFMVQSLTALIETRDVATGRHARRTQEYSRLLATELARRSGYREYLTRERIELIAELSPLHDIGKVGIPDAILNKPGALSEQEVNEMRRHPHVGHETIERAERQTGAGLGSDELLLQLAKDIIYTHHERWDGRGYPRGLRGDEIPIAGRIVALVDVYDALSHSRTYRHSLSHGEAVATIMAGRGTHFDPDVVDAFLALESRFRELSVRAAEEGQR